MSYLSIRTTEFGGRGYFSTRPIPKNTEILRCQGPFTGVIFKPFKKEVCAYCFSYDNGKSRKIRLDHPPPTKRAQPAYGGVHFCTEQCRDQWVRDVDFEGLISEALNNIELGCAQKGQPAVEMNHAHSHVDDVWKSVENDTNATKQIKIPSLEPEEYDSARMIAIALVKKYRAISSRSENDEWNSFTELQSNETELLKKFPELLTSHVKIYKFLRATMTSMLQPYLSTDLIRQTIGKEAGNAFGLWQLPLHLESECMGSNLYSLASFFNHSCDPSVHKERVGRDMVFTTTRDILPDEQLYISYGMLNHLNWNERVKQLNDQWHFICNCARCAVEKEGGEWAKL